ncbi:hypothetical protein SEA_KASHFLOW_125 [Mycobacterium phage KashFlow]|nr:hypothetical protein SEA_KASHFLOW_125 [Mycobacterium phage KashFlow]
MDDLSDGSVPLYAHSAAGPPHSTHKYWVADPKYAFTLPWAPK